MLLRWLTPARSRWLFGLALVGVTCLALIPDNQVPVTTGWDKSNHLLAFFVLALLAALAWPSAAWWGQALGLVGYGIGIENLQYFVGRDAAALDVLADSLGIALWWAAVAISPQSLMRRQS